MRVGRRLLALGCAVAAGAAACPAQAVTQTATVTASVVKPLTLVSVQNFDLGTITLNPGNWAPATVSLSRLGVLVCPPVAFTCSGTTSVAQYKVTGTNKGVVLISTPNVVMTNQSDPSKTLTLVVDSPLTVTLTSSGEPGVTFPLGGSVILGPTTASGNYVGTFNVTVDYQ